MSDAERLKAHLASALKREQVLREAIVEVIGVLKCHPEKEGGDNKLSAADRAIMRLCDDALEKAPFSLNEQWLVDLVNQPRPAGISQEPS